MSGSVSIVEVDELQATPLHQHRGRVHSLAWAACSMAGTQPPSPTPSATQQEPAAARSSTDAHSSAAGPAGAQSTPPGVLAEGSAAAEALTEAPGAQPQLTQLAAAVGAEDGHVSEGAVAPGTAADCNQPGAGMARLCAFSLSLSL